MTAIDNIRKALVAVADCTSISGIEGAMCGLYAVTTTDKLAEVLAHIDAQSKTIQSYVDDKRELEECFAEMKAEIERLQTRPIHNTELVIEAIREELYTPKPYDQTALELCDKCGWKTLVPGEGCLNCERPAWQDAPTGPGLWLNSISGRVNVVIEETLSAWQNTGARWFGPLPEDKQ